MIDLIFSVMNSPQRPLDFSLLFHLKEPVYVEALRTGAKSARNLYPQTGSFINKNRWVRLLEPSDGISAVTVASNSDANRVIAEFINSSFDPGQQMPVQQLMITSEVDAGVKLVTRFHHAAADGLSAAMWLGHQLRVAYGKEAAIDQPSTFQELRLRSHPSPVKRSRFAYDEPSHRLWCKDAQPSRTRCWQTIKIEATNLRKYCRSNGGFTYNDLLATSALEVFTRWNRRHSAGDRQKVGLWLPVNIRQEQAVGFGNGTSRIRLYAQYAETLPLAEKCREIHRQVSWSNQHGEWGIPSKPLWTYLPQWAISPLLRCFLNRPGIDMATGVFSHAERLAEKDRETFQGIEKIESIGQLHADHRVVINGVTHFGQTWLTFTYDPVLFSSDNIQSLIEMYQEQIALAERELS